MDKYKRSEMHAGSIRDSKFFTMATKYCLDLFWGRYGGDWEATYMRWSSTLGIPDLDKNAWADSCPKDPGYDELGNYMTYNTPVCFAALGHFTVEQAQRAHYLASEYNPIMYAWGQYYYYLAHHQVDADSAPQQQQQSVHVKSLLSPEGANDISCRETANSACGCKEAWQYKGKSYSFCDIIKSDDVILRCEVANPWTCPECSALPKGQQCILTCTDQVPSQCKVRHLKVTSSLPCDIGAAVAGYEVSYYVLKVSAVATGMPSWAVPTWAVPTGQCPLGTTVMGRRRLAQRWAQRWAQRLWGADGWHNGGHNGYGAPTVVTTVGTTVGTTVMGRRWLAQRRICLGVAELKTHSLYIPDFILIEASGLQYWEKRAQCNSDAMPIQIKLFTSVLRPTLAFLLVTTLPANGQYDKAVTQQDGSTIGLSSSGALLPYLTTSILYTYASQPRMCSTSLVENLYELSQGLYGTSTLQVPGQPQATAAWPDLTALSEADFTAAVRDALLLRGSGGAQLADAAATVSGPCGLSITDFAGLVPRISSALKQLHADLVELQSIAQQRLTFSQRLRPRSFFAATARTRRRVNGEARSLLGHNDRHLAAGKKDMETAEAALRRSLQASASNRIYSMPPDDFTIQPPSSTPKVLVGMVFHILQYTGSDGAIGPPKYTLAPQYVERALRLVNYMAAPTNFSFFAQEVRTDAEKYPYLLLKTRKSWLSIVLANCNGKGCLRSSDFVNRTVSDFPRSINIYVGSDSTAPIHRIMGYSYYPLSDLQPDNGYMFIAWDQLSVDGANSPAAYNDGAVTILHEAFHALGLWHTFSDASPGCTDGDLISDTPTVKRNIFMTDFRGKAASYCLDLFWGRYGGDWEATYMRWSSTLGIPDLDKNAWADSCPNDPGYDELGNYMTYNTPVCFAALGHFTVGQMQYAHEMTYNFNPVMYAWGQYYAAHAAAEQQQQQQPPPPSEAPRHPCQVRGGRSPILLCLRHQQHHHMPLDLPRYICACVRVIRDNMKGAASTLL
ncbi:hypothetical protein VOLCADRAFT_106937 [Volvox carteri f. nagariensis]|uniref:Uncharacterized protein n=1 Tax=Volvox carteri f. nagariensis TaxID=3068 RepID=D8UAQ5_VOLCA|nr:uncharacterized protein VOLCADRAFT_106937 [Volvox carteri f. nagariensis]EFJ43196.1 hypothetical protein VOLCADRAFT_106937 [Volvox carteri f. nagariensis]|eukprot:XP_002955771.1 hypothetical protein VOLCADRAFT_106937 [Volvox carteri f. nagariensis]